LVVCATHEPALLPCLLEGYHLPTGNAAALLLDEHCFKLNIESVEVVMLAPSFTQLSVE
jgi:hypothetical protein